VSTARREPSNMSIAIISLQLCFQGLRLGGIDFYHYQTVIYLAWMSSSVHLSAITLLAPLLKERPALRIWPFTGMIVLLVVEMASHGFRKQPLGRSCYLLLGIGVSQKGQTTVKIVRWRMTTRWRAGVNADAVLSYIILVSSYC
jgi:hypothetical protein